MISGITTALNLDFHGFPYDLAIRTWLNVCDEIIVVTDPKEHSLDKLLNWASQFGDKVKIRGVNSPRNFEVFRFLGYMFCNNPNYVVHFDLDYLISPTDAALLRNTILSAADDTDIITYKLCYLNYYATHTTWIPKQREVPPHDGTHGEYPLVVNPRRQIFIAPYEGVTEDNLLINYESIICLRPDKWGKTYNTKYLKSANPFRFNIVESNATVEHLFWFLKPDALKKKLSHPYWVDQLYDTNWAKKGFDPYNKTYQELEEARERLRSMPIDGIQSNL